MFTKRKISIIPYPKPQGLGRGLCRILNKNSRLQIISVTYSNSESVQGCIDQSTLTRRIFMTTANNTIAIGTITTCQFGNKGDYGWTEEKNCNIEVEVLDQKVQGLQTYLVRKVSNHEYLGMATNGHGKKAGVLYCTTARPFGASADKRFGPETELEARKSLGF